MAADWDRVLDRLCLTPLVGDLRDLLLKAGEQDPDQVDIWKLLIAISSGTEHRRRALLELRRLEPDQEAWRTQLALLPSTAPTVVSPVVSPVPPVQPRFRVAWGTRLAVWAAVLSMMCVIAIAYFNVANQESLLGNERPIDLLWFARRSEPEISPDAQRITQRLAELDRRFDQLQSSTNSLIATARGLGATGESLHRNVSDLKNSLRQSELRQDRFETEFRASTDRVVQLIQSLDARVGQWQKAQSRVVNPFWDWYWRDRSPQKSPPNR